MVDLLERIAEVGSMNAAGPHLSDVEIFKPYFSSTKDGQSVLNEADLDLQDGNCTRREVITRFLLLNAVLDQGPDMEGVRHLLADTLNQLYRRELRILHKPIRFFQELGIAIEKIDEVHEVVRKLREPEWQKSNKTTKLCAVCEAHNTHPEWIDRYRT
ncbi:MAG: hypothetical protein LBR16_07680 [Treponema sp.]|jgi:hypothetical protein|nr:hypothetical protein [Treponema sp.]